MSQALVSPATLGTVRPRPWLLPLGLLYGAGAATRVALFRSGAFGQSRLRGPVISVGNLGVGGRSKTPLVAHLADIVRRAGLPVAILSRGHGGSFRGEALVVGDGDRLLADAALAGDEPVMLARALPGVVVAVGRRRDVVGALVERRFGRRVHVLDDGFQHLRLFRDLDLVCLSARDLRDRPLPAGALREFPSAARRADVAVLIDEDSGADVSIPLPAERVFRLRRRVVGITDALGAACPPPRRAFLLAAIAEPDRFAADARGRVDVMAGQAFFPDHHVFRPRELEAVVAQARQAGADALLTTAKDRERLPEQDLGLPLRVLHIEVWVEDEARFREHVLAVARRLALRPDPGPPPVKPRLT